MLNDAIVKNGFSSSLTICLIWFLGTSRLFMCYVRTRWWLSRERSPHSRPFRGYARNNQIPGEIKIDSYNKLYYNYEQKIDHYIKVQIIFQHPNINVESYKESNKKKNLKFNNDKQIPYILISATFIISFRTKERVLSFISRNHDLL